MRNLEKNGLEEAEAIVPNTIIQSAHGAAEFARGWWTCTKRELCLKKWILKIARKRTKICG